MLVVAAVSSMKTSFFGSRVSCSSRKALRAAATSGRSCSAASMLKQRLSYAGCAMMASSPRLCWMAQWTAPTSWPMSNRSLLPPTACGKGSGVEPVNQDATARRVPPSTGVRKGERIACQCEMAWSVALSMAEPQAPARAPALAGAFPMPTWLVDGISVWLQIQSVRPSIRVAGHCGSSNVLNYPAAAGRIAC
jgi:hypothetical protein